MTKHCLPNVRPVRAPLAALTFFAVVCGALSFAPQSAAKSVNVVKVNFVRIAATGDDPPGATGPFTGFDIVSQGFTIQINAPALDETGRVAFVGRDGNTPSGRGVYIGHGPQIVTIADRSDDAPGLVGPYTFFREPAISPFGVVFQGGDAFFRTGIFADPTGSLGLRPIAQFFDRLPGSTDTFNFVSHPNISGVYIAFWGNFPAGVADKEGVFVGRTIRTSGSIVPDLFLVAATGDDPAGPVGPIDSFGIFDSITNSGSLAAFVATDANFNDGIFVGSFPVGSALVPPRRNFRPVLSEGDPLPGGFGPLFAPDFIDIDGPELAFHDYSLSGSNFEQGIFVVDIQSRKVRTVVATPHDPPGRVGPIGDQGMIPAISESMVAFVATDAAGNAGLFINIEGALHLIVDTFGTIDGKRVSHISFGAQGLNGPSAAFGVQFTDGSQAVYRADLTVEKQKKPKK